MSDGVAWLNVITILSDPALARINLSIGGVAINLGLFTRVLAGVITKRIEVRHVPRLVGPGIYNSTENRFYFRRDTFTSLPAKALVVHEACHAGCDAARATGMRTLQSETAAFIAQCAYARAKCADPTNQRLVDDDPRLDRIFELAWEIAGTVLRGGSPGDSAIRQLKFAISRHPNYTSSARDLAGFNGIPGV